MQDWSGIFDLDSPELFKEWALKLYRHQRANVSVYRSFCEHLGVGDVNQIQDIPFLPISFFKTHRVCESDLPITQTFKSSGTGNSIRSQHFVQNEWLYQQSFFKHYEAFFGPPSEQVILALLPNYLEQGASSLVYMVDHLISATKSELSGFVLDNPNALTERIETAKKRNKRVVLFGVSYALIDLAETSADLSGIHIVETGGMKGRRKEWSKEQLHQFLHEKMNAPQIYSEYGMTELFSQGYARMHEPFQLPAWMKVKIRSVNDPLSFEAPGKSGGINVIDLANVHSCAFIATDDLGKLVDGQLQLLGRIDHSDTRGCNLLIQ